MAFPSLARQSSVQAENCRLGMEMPPTLSAQTMAVSFGVSDFGQGAALRSLGWLLGGSTVSPRPSPPPYVSISLLFVFLHSPFFVFCLFPLCYWSLKHWLQVADLGHARTTVPCVSRGDRKNQQMRFIQSKALMGMRFPFEVMRKFWN